MELPPKNEILLEVPLGEPHHKLYEKLYKFARKQLANSTDQSVNPLQMIVRLRQMCLAVGLLPTSFLDTVMNGTEDDIKRLFATMRQKTVEELFRQSLCDDEECMICMEKMSLETDDDGQY